MTVFLSGFEAFRIDPLLLEQLGDIDRPLIGKVWCI
jgi:hypothetical protein